MSRLDLEDEKTGIRTARDRGPSTARSDPQQGKGAFRRFFLLKGLRPLISRGAGQDDAMTGIVLCAGILTAESLTRIIHEGF